MTPEPTGCATNHSRTPIPPAEPVRTPDPGFRQTSHGSRSTTPICSPGNWLESVRAPRARLLLPGLKRLRRTGRESRGRIEQRRVYRRDRAGRQESVRCGGGRQDRLLEAASGTLPRAGRSSRRAPGTVGQPQRHAILANAADGSAGPGTAANARTGWARLRNHLGVHSDPFEPRARAELLEDLPRLGQERQGLVSPTLLVEQLAVLE
jgi:hypothetical protein